MATAAEERQGQLEPAVASTSNRGWQRWAATLVRWEWERLAGFGLVLVLGFLAGAGAVYGFTRLAGEMLEHETNQMDSAAAAYVQQWQSPTMNTLAWFVSLFGSELIMAFALVLLGLFIWQRRWGAGALLVLVCVGAQVLNDVLKIYYHRVRPEPVSGLIAAQSWSFPSGHAMMSAAFYLLVGYLGWRLLKGAARWILAFGLVVLVLLIGVSRIYLQAHFLSDVLAGYVAGFVWSDAVILGSKVLSTRRRTLAS